LVPPSYEGDRNDYAISAARADPAAFAVQARIDLTRQMRQVELRQVVDGRLVKGLRLTFNGDASRRLVDGDVDWLWPLASELEIPVSVYPWSSTALRDSGEWQALREVAERYPQLSLGIDHFGVGQWVTSETLHEELDRVTQMGRFSNVALKVSALSVIAGERCLDSAFVGRVMRPLVEALGPSRLFWGSDRTRSAINYLDEIEAFIDGLSFLDDEGIRMIMGEAILDWLGWS
jgi:L-fuconolactonase